MSLNPLQSWWEEETHLDRGTDFHSPLELFTSTECLSGGSGFTSVSITLPPFVPLSYEAKENHATPAWVSLVP